MPKAQLKRIYIILMVFSQITSLVYGESLEQIIRQKPSPTLGAIAVDLESGKEIFSINPQLSVTPASVLKLVISYAALKKFGPEYTISTKFFISKGSRTDLYVQGGGDPSLTSEDLWLIARELKRKGIKEIHNLILDTSIFTATGRRGLRAYESTAHPLSLNYNSVRIWACGAPNGKINSGVDPEEYSPKVLSKVGFGDVSLLDVGSFEGPDEQLVVEGTLNPSERCTSVYRSVDDVEHYFSVIFEKSLKDAGIKLQGDFKSGKVPGEASLILNHPSKPLSEIITGLNHFSTNMIAETLLELVACEDKNCSKEDGIQHVEDLLGRIGLSKGEFHIEDGSGFDRANKISVNGIVKVLRKALNDPEVAPEYLSSLSILGRAGTLKSRKVEGEYVLFRGKTGFLNGVHSLAGQLQTKKGHLILVVLVQNDVADNNRAMEWEESVLRALYHQY